MPNEQRGLFDESGAVSPVTPLVGAGASGKALTKRQRQFNRLTARLQELRGELTSWQRAVDRYRQRAAAELDPLRRELLAEQRAAVLLIDALLSSTAKDDRLTRGRRRKLCDLIVMLAESVLEAGPDENVEAIFDRRSSVRHRDIRRNELELAETMFGVILGDDLMAGHTATSVDELFEQAGERLHAKLNAEAEQAQARGTRSKRPEPVQEPETNRSLRDLFRRLAAAVHPDREPDDTERVRKTVLMQRVNRAYEGNDLLDLLTVQIEIEQIDSGHLARASDERLGHYCAVLREQQRTLEGELIALQAPFRVALDLAPYGRGLRPEALDVLVDRDARNGREALDELRNDMEALRDPARRGAMIDSVEIGRAEPDQLDAVLFEADFAPPPVRRRKGKAGR